MDSTFEIEPNYGKLIGENNKLQKLVTDMNRGGSAEGTSQIDTLRFQKPYASN